MMGGLDIPTSGKVKVRGKELSEMKDEQLTIFRRRNIGFIFQNYNLVPVLNVYENIVLPVELDGDSVDQKFMDEVVGMLALKDKLNHMPNNLSGGSSSVWRLPEPWFPNRQSFWRTSRQETLTAGRAAMFWGF